MKRRTHDRAQLEIFFEPVNKPSKDKKGGNHRKKVEAKTRRLKIQYGHYRNTYRRVPMLMLKGLWLGEAGFSINDVVEIQVSSGELTIRKI